MRNFAQRIAWSYLGRPYIWGGDDPTGFDCSGLMIECMKSVGVLAREGDWTAAGLFGLFTQIKEKDLRAGDLVFWGNPIVHVEMIVKTKIGDSPALSIGASGGGSWATNPEEAYKRGAYVKVRPIATRGGLMRFVNPFGD